MARNTLKTSVLWLRLTGMSLLTDYDSNRTLLRRTMKKVGFMPRCFKASEELSLGPPSWDPTEIKLCDTPSRWHQASCSHF